MDSKGKTGDWFWSGIIVKKKAPHWNTDGQLTEMEDYKYYGKTSETLRIHLQDFAEKRCRFCTL